MNADIVQLAIKAAGGIKAVSQACGVTYECARQWFHRGLPRTEWTGETSYAQTIANMQTVYSSEDMLKRPK